MKTDITRIQRDIENLAKFSCVEGCGCTRYSYSKEFAQARDYIVSEMKAAGLSVREDPMGIVIGRMEGTNPDAPLIMTGSHFDTVRTGGRFDGAAGVVAALEAARTMHDEGFVPSCPIEFVALPEEEGSRFGGGLTASRAMCGKLYPNELDEYKDPDGISMREAMIEYGLDPTKVDECIRDPKSIRAFIELHIEQGPVLENNKKDIGIVESIVGLRCITVTVHGKSGHAGTTPMNMRQDASLAAAQAIVDGTNKAKALADGTVVTFGTVNTKPGAFNIIAYEAMFTIDCRSGSMESVNAVLDEVKASLERSAAENPGITFDMEEKLIAQPVIMKEEIKNIMRSEADDAGISYMSCLSGAGHDAMIMGGSVDVAMIFVPSKDGLSHVPEEWTDYDQLQNGIEVLTRTIETMAK